MSARKKNDEPRRRLRGDVRRERLLDAATRVFAEKGYEATSFGDIAKLSGISRSVVYDHFTDKAELYLLLLERERDRIVEHLDRQLVAAGTPEERVAHALDVFFAYVEAHAYAWRMLFRDAGGDSRQVATQRKIQNQAHLAIATMLAKERGAKILSGRDKELRLEMLSTVWGAATNGLARWWYDHRKVPRQQIVAASMDALWLGAERLREGERWRTPRAKRS